MKQKQSVIRPCSNTTCTQGNACPNFTPRYTKNSFAFPSCMYNPIYIAEYASKVTDANKQRTTRLVKS